MDVDTKALMEKIENLSEAYNNFSEAWIKFSLAYSRVSQQMHDLKADHPTLFNTEGTQT